VRQPELGETFGVFVTGLDGPPLTLRVHEDPSQRGRHRAADSCLGLADLSF
jgi:hypothetical protein